MEGNVQAPVLEMLQSTFPDGVMSTFQEVVNHLELIFPMPDTRAPAELERGLTAPQRDAVARHIISVLRVFKAYHDTSIPRHPARPQGRICCRNWPDHFWGNWGCDRDKGQGVRGGNCLLQPCRRRVDAREFPHKASYYILHLTGETCLGFD